MEVLRRFAERRKTLEDLAEYGVANTDEEAAVVRALANFALSELCAYDF